MIDFSWLENVVECFESHWWWPRDLEGCAKVGKLFGSNSKLPQGVTIRTIQLHSLITDAALAVYLQERLDSYGIAIVLTNIRCFTDRATSVFLASPASF